MTDTEERIKHNNVRAAAMNLNAKHSQLGRESRRVGSFLRSADNCFVGNKPVVSPAPEISAFRMSPTPDIGLVGVRDAYSQAVQRSCAVFCQMENVLMAVIHVPLRMKGFEMPGRNQFALFRLNGN